MKCSHLIFSLFLMCFSINAHADSKQANVYCSLDDHLDDRKLVLGQKFTGKLVLNEKDAEKSVFQIPTFSAPTLNNRKYIMYFQYVGEIGNKGMDVDPTEIFRISLYDVEKNVYASSTGNSADIHYASFIYPDKTLISATCRVQML